MVVTGRRRTLEVHGIDGVARHPVIRDDARSKTSLGIVTHEH